MKYLKIIVRRLLFPVFILLLFGNCSKKDSVSGSSNDSDWATPIIEFQELQYQRFEEMIVSMDSTSAQDSIISLFRADSLVLSVDESDQGFFVVYNDSILGGFFLDPEDNPEQDSLLYTEPPPPVSYKASNLRKPKPDNPRTALINPHYFEREKYTDWLLPYYDVYFKQAGYDEPERYFNEEASVDKFTYLDGYGIVHIYSHGCYRRNTGDVFLMTGERENRSTSSEYKRHIKSGRIAIKTNKHGSFYFLHPDFIAEYNDFSQDTTVVYGGFCYSYLGGWPSTIGNNCDAGSYIGYDWSVYTHYNVFWARRLFSSLSDTSQIFPVTVDEWFNDSTVKYHWNKKYEKHTTVRNYGYPTLTLWDASVPRFNYADIFVNGINAVFNLTGDYFTSNEDVLRNHVDAFIVETDTSFVGSWDENTGYYDHIGNLEFKLNPHTNEITYFHINEHQIFGDWGTRTYEITGGAIPVPYWESREDYYLSGPEVNDCLTTFTYTETVEETSSRTLTTYTCDNNSVISIRLSNE